MSKFLDNIKKYEELKNEVVKVDILLDNYKKIKSDLQQEVESCFIKIDWVGRDFGGGVVYGEHNEYPIDKSLRDGFLEIINENIDLYESQKGILEYKIKEYEED